MIAFTTWIVIGLIAGFTGHMFSHDRGERFILDLFLGVSGAFLGGWAVDSFGYAGPMGVNVRSILAAIIGAMILVAGFHTFQWKKHSLEP